jgi:Sigma-70, region 4
MARIDELPPDQRAAVQLLLKQQRSYDDIAGMLRIEPSAVRERARAALDALGPEEVDGLELSEQDEIADYLLGQQTASERAETRALLERSAPGRAWARAVAGELRPLAGDDLPDVPDEAPPQQREEPAVAAAKPRRRDRLVRGAGAGPPAPAGATPTGGDGAPAARTSRVGGAILLAGLALAVIIGILLLTGAFDGGDGDGDGGGTANTTQTQTQAGEPQVEAQVNLTPPEGGDSNAAGVAQIARQGNQRAVALVAQGLPAANRSRFYAIWLYTSQTQAQFLGFPNPQPERNGRIETGFGLPNDANRYRELVITRETQERPRRPGTIVLRGRLELPAN